MTDIAGLVARLREHCRDAMSYLDDETGHVTYGAMRLGYLSEAATQAASALEKLQAELLQQRMKRAELVAIRGELESERDALRARVAELEEALSAKNSAAAQPQSTTPAPT